MSFLTKKLDVSMKSALLSQVLRKRRNIPLNIAAAGAVDRELVDIFCFFVFVLGQKTCSRRARRGLKRCLEAVGLDSFWLSLSPNGATGTRFVAETVVLGLMTGDW